MTRTHRLLAPAIAASLLVAAGTAAADEQGTTGQPLPPVFAKVLDCRKLDDAAARLACFDTSVAALESASAQKTVVVMSEETVKETRRGLFGLSLPRLGLFNGSDDEDEIKELTTTIAGVRGADGSWTFTLADGAAWQKTDGIFVRTPKPGQSITIRRAALGSFMANIEGGPGFRVKRVN